ncbi:MAG: alpha-glucosidase/alpha-galactosidase [Chloroflexi bacterium]|uniref:alpha-glucosidase/alpha-galactosidase n=1 Tax=Candidatus Flexifilum breve TaxID=3140694 RepID=UPI003136649B|nr:alpha-glucosidase/alpha-galactosidase [Chloroflexota bacterium]
MTKITFVGAGSVVFTRNLCSDILLTPALQDATITLMDIDAVRLERSRALVQALIEQRGLSATVEATLDRREAVRGAQFVITTFQQGGLDAYQLDIDLPLKYGVGQCVGDTLGPGGVFRGLRTIPVLLDLCRDMDDLAPDALLLNYVNPMAINCWAVAEGAGRPHVGLCHSVQGTSEMLARWIGVPYDEITYLCAGINHQAFFLDFRRGAEDLYPRLWAALDRADVISEEPVRGELMRYFGYFVTESSGHASEYVPYYRKSSIHITEHLVPRFTNPGDSWFNFGQTGGYLRHCLERVDTAEQEFRDLIDGTTPAPTERTHEYGAAILEAVVTRQPARINGNVPNTGLITNLPAGCCVEVPCLVDANGVQGVYVGKLPTQLAALNRTNINVQELTVEAALRGDRDAVHHAVLLDPLTAAVCTPPQVHQMVDELLAAQAEWLPQFKQ